MAGYLVTSFSMNSKPGWALPARYLLMDMSLVPICLASH